MEKKLTQIILILISIFIGFYSGLAAWYMTHKHIQYSFYISVVIGFIVSIVFYFWCNKEGDEDDSVQDKKRKISKKELKILYILVIVLFASLIIWFISLFLWSVESSNLDIINIIGLVACVSFFCILFSSYIYIGRLKKKYKSD